MHIRSGPGIAVVVCMLAIILLSGCRQEQEAEDAALTVQEPQPSGLLTIWVDRSTNTDIAQEIEEPLKKMYPRLMLRTEYFGNRGQHIEELIASGHVPDILFADSSQLPLLARHHLLDSLDTLAENTLDLAPFNSMIMEYIRSYDGRLLGIPYASNVYALFYNKKIFDALDLHYPYDHMTWEEVFELAGQVGIRAQGKYLPLDIVHPHLLVSQASLSYIDATTGKANLETDGWQALLSMMQEIPRIPGNDKLSFYRDQSIQAGFASFESGHAAMAIGALEGEPGYVFRTTNLERAESGSVDWDIVSFPVVNRDGGGPVPSFQFLAVHPDSPNKREAFQVIRWLVSKEKQEANAALSRASARTDIQLADTFAASHNIWIRKNIGAFFANRNTEPVGTAYEDGALAMQAEHLLSMLIWSKNIDRSEIMDRLTSMINETLEKLSGHQ